MKHLKKFMINEEGKPVSGELGDLGKLVTGFKNFWGVEDKGSSDTGVTLGDLYSQEGGENVKNYGNPNDAKVTITKPIKDQMDLIRKYLVKYKITNPLVQDAILATIGKESGYKFGEEASYANTSARRIREVYGNRNGIDKMSDAQLDEIKKKPIEFWDLVYGGEWGKRQLGNTQSGDGYKYVGRGYNGITGKSNYENLAKIMKYNKSKFDIARDPYILAKNTEAMAEANAAYFSSALKHRLLKSKYNYSDPNDIKDFDTALMAVLNANAGAGNNMRGNVAREGIKNSKSFASKYGLGKKNDEISRTA